MLKKNDPHIEGDLGELFRYCPDAHVRRKAEVERCFAGGDNVEFHVPAADTGIEIFFRSREMLAKYNNIYNQAK
jgi:hypothetical protein